MLLSKLPVPIIKILKFMCENVFTHVCFNGFKGSTWKVGNGTRQGGILSPYLFNFYIDEVINKMCNINVGCSLSFESVNILAYADDILLLAPSLKGLQFLIDQFCYFIEGMSLNISTEKDKSEYIVFSNKKFSECYSIILNECVLKNVQASKYLGCIFSADLGVFNDVDKCNMTFLKQFNSLYHKFSFLNRDAQCFLMKSFCLSFYGAELWYDQFLIKRVVNKISVSYHRAMKRIAGLLTWDSNHLGAEITGLPIFKHFLADRMISFLFSIVFNKSNSLVGNLHNYFKYDSFLFRSISNIFNENYNVLDIFNNDLLALKSRIYFIQRTEPRSFYNIPCT